MWVVVSKPVECRTPGGAMVRVLRRILALTAAIRHNEHTGPACDR